MSVLAQRRRHRVRDRRPRLDRRQVADVGHGDDLARGRRPAPRCDRRRRRARSPGSASAAEARAQVGRAHDRRSRRARRRPASTSPAARKPRRIAGVARGDSACSASHGRHRRRIVAQQARQLGSTGRRGAGRAQHQRAHLVGPRQRRLDRDQRAQRMADQHRRPEAQRARQLADGVAVARQRQPARPVQRRARRRARRRAPADRSRPRARRARRAPAPSSRSPTRRRRRGSAPPTAGRAGARRARRSGCGRRGRGRRRACGPTPSPARISRPLSFLTSAISAGIGLLPGVDQAVVGDLEDGRFGVLVDRDDHLRALHARRGAGWRPRSRPRCRAAARRPCRSGRPAGRSAPCRRRAAARLAPSAPPSRSASSSSTLKFSPSFMPRPPETTTLASLRSGRALLRRVQRRPARRPARRRAPTATFSTAPAAPPAAAGGNAVWRTLATTTLPATSTSSMRVAGVGGPLETCSRPAPR